MQGIQLKFRSLVTLVLALLCVGTLHKADVEGTAENPILSYDFLYNEGVDTYLEENWEGCVKNFELALEDWHWWKSNIIRCRRQCSQEGSEGDLLSIDLLEEDKFFEKAVRSTLCLVKCKKEAFGSRMDRVAEAHIEEDFDMKKPYDYLQLCYYKLDKVKEAADAAATVLASQPDHEVMKNNLKIYLGEGGIDATTVVNRELKEYGKLYIQGNAAYNENDYEQTIVFMEGSLKAFYDADDDCRRLCENPFDQGWFPDFISSIANHYTFTLRCKRRCDWNLSNLYGDRIENFYSSFFNYLQYSYFKGGELEKACEAVASALLLDPEDEVQLRNKKYYLFNEDVTEDMFVPRKDVIRRKERLDYEEKMMDYIETNFFFLNDEEFLEDVDDDDVKKKGDITLENSKESPKVFNSSSLEEDELDSTVISLGSQNVVKDEM